MIYAASYFPPHCLVDEHAAPVEYVAEVLGVGGAIKIQSGAGSGKTTLLARIAKWYVASFILFCAFTIAAVSELKERDDIDEGSVHTTHSVGLKALNANYRRHHGRDAREMRGEEEPDLLHRMTVVKSTATTHILLQHLLLGDGADTWRLKYRVCGKFVPKLLDMAMMQGFGVAGYPAFDDAAQLRSVAATYGLPSIIEEDFNALPMHNQIAFTEVRRYCAPSPMPRARAPSLAA